MYTVSVIMPVYNNEKTLEKAIESILNQKMYDFDLIYSEDLGDRLYSNINILVLKTVMCGIVFFFFITILLLGE